MISSFRIIAILSGFVLVANPIRATEPLLQSVMSLRACLEAAAHSNYELRARLLEVQAQEARSEYSERERWPLVSVFAAVQQHSVAQRIDQPSANMQLATFSRSLALGGIGLSLPLYTGGGLEAQEQMNAQLAEAARWDAGSFRDQTLLNTLQLYHKMQALDFLTESVEASIRALQAQSERIDALIRQQKAADVDRLRVQVRLASLEQQRIEIRSQWRDVREALNFLMGVPAGSEWGIEKMSDSGEESELNRMPSAAPEGKREDELAARMRREATGSRLEMVRAGKLPNVKLESSWNLRSGMEGAETYDDAVVALSVSWDLWDSGRRKQLEREADMLHRASQTRESAVSARRRQEQESTASALDSANERLRVALQNQATAAEALRIEQRKYEEGRGTISEVLDAEAASLESDSLIALARADYYVALAQRDYANGQLFNEHAGHPALQQPLSITR